MNVITFLLMNHRISLPSSQLPTPSPSHIHKTRFCPESLRPPALLSATVRLGKGPEGSVVAGSPQPAFCSFERCAGELC